MRQVIALNLGYFGIEIAVALSIGSVALFADAIDFLEDGTVNALALLALGWSARARGRLGGVLAGVLLLPAIATVWTAWRKLGAPSVPAAVPLGLTGAGALAVNLACALMLARWRHAGGSLTKAAFLSARNDVAANVAIVVAGALTALLVSPWPDLVVGLGILALNLDAAREVWVAARAERLSAGRMPRRGPAPAGRTAPPPAPPVPPPPPSPPS
ncbi:cation transporter [Acidisphaera rubrifaciens]|uniref:Cation efflux protein n=1 Tax=Acidisphaera rubrifaciens HS-AP3 TaxID=1231350 RepID=A0A0D6PAX8_9PROT|nr:cation transporter [Acidisphaera rubrifaciens]GAN78516.1 cation efflux protein [Acidisphaera rubrifaciens HS-AP3]